MANPYHDGKRNAPKISPEGFTREAIRRRIRNADNYRFANLLIMRLEELNSPR
jgi:hypothetical protein